jgi:ribosome biogenesis protein ERB1
LPIHAESYNPPEEYLLDDEEKEKIEEMDEIDRPYNFTP